LASKILAYDTAARGKMQRGADQVADAVKVTLGPRGRTVLIDKSWGSPTVTKDGVTVAKEIDLPEPIENLGAQLVKEVAKKTNDVAGDGTTTATVLAQAILAEGLRNVGAGASPLLLKRGIDIAVAKVVEGLKAGSEPVSDKAAYQDVATIAGNDPEVGRLVAEALDSAGRDGVVTIEEGKTSETSIEVVEGMQFDKGYLSPYLVTDPEAMEANLEEPYILLWEKKISDVNTLVPLLQQIHGSGRPLVIIAEDVEGQALAALVVNALRGVVRSVAVKAPGFGDRRKAIMGDIAVLTGGTFVTEELGIPLDNVTLEQLGRADKVVVTHDNTTIIGGQGAADAIAGRLRQIKDEIEKTTSDYDREKLQERQAKLSGGVAVIKIGAATETELKERKYRFEDALNSTKAAIEEGIVTGGGVALARSAAVLAGLSDDNDDVRSGISIVARAVGKPLRQIAENAGLNGQVVLNKVLETADAGYGFNAATLVYEDLKAAGVVDAAKVVRLAIENAGSIAGMVLTTECAIAEKPEKPKPAPAGGPGGGMDGMGY
jgi:chaperonin GroEL